MPFMGIVLEVRDLVKVYPTDGVPVRALDAISLSVEKGEFVAIMGASGSGKGTLLHLMGGLDQPTAGSIHIEGNDILAMNDKERTLFRRRRMGIIFQAYNLIPTLDAIENVALVTMIDGSDTARAMEKAAALLEQVDLGHRMRHRPQALSGGEQQRVAIARAMMNDPAVVLADEPTGNLDSQHAQAIWRLLAALSKDRDCTVVAVTHESTGATFADRVVMLKDGRVVDTVTPGGEQDASMVAARYAQLAS